MYLSPSGSVTVFAGACFGDGVAARAGTIASARASAPMNFFIDSRSSPVRRRSMRYVRPTRRGGRSPLLSAYHLSNVSTRNGEYDIGMSARFLVCPPTQYAKTYDAPD